MAAVVAGVLLGILAPGASAELSFCPPGEAAGQCQSPQEVAVDFETGQLYVADQGNHRIDVFDDAGEFLFAFGWGVDTGAEAEETCTTASGCQKGLPGSGAGQLSAPRWIAVDNVVGSPTRHHVYVSDGNFRINQFDENGEFVNAFGWGVLNGVSELQVCTTVSGCMKGISGGGECQIGGNRRPVSVGPEGNVFAAITAGTEPKFTTKVSKFNPAGECLGETVLWTEENRLALTLVIDAEEDAYVSVDRAGGEIRKYDLEVAESELCDVDDGINTLALALDEAGHLFAGQLIQNAKKSGSYNVVAEYETSSCPGGLPHVRRFGYDEIDDIVRGVAPLHSAEGDVFVSAASGPIKYIFSGGPGPISIARSLEAPVIGNAQATVYGELNPEGAPTDVRIDYVSEADYDEDVGKGGNGFEGEGVRSTEVANVGEGFRAVGYEAELGCEVATPEAIEAGECLTPETIYRWRAVATNEDEEGEGAQTVAEAPPFETKPPLEATVFASGVDTSTATMNALVNPLGIAAEGHFEYVTEEIFTESGFAEATRVPAAGEIEFGEGGEAIRHSVTLFPLAPGTAFRFRLVASSALVEEPLLFEGAFRTHAIPEVEPCPANEEFRSGLSANLPDCRAYELVSPLDKANGDIVLLLDPPAGINQAAGSGERFAYGSYRAFGDAESAPYTSQYLAARDPETGWLTRGISPFLGKQLTDAVPIDYEFRAFSEDLCQGWIVPLFEPPLTEDAEPGHRNLYRRNDRLCGEEGYELFSRGKPEGLERLYDIELQGAAEEGDTAAYLATDTIVGSGAPEQPGECTDSKGVCRERLYVQETAGTPRFVCVYPDGSTKGNLACSAGSHVTALFVGERSFNAPGALAEDASRIYWSAEFISAPLYLRENPTEPEEREFGRAKGKGNLVGPVVAKGDLVSGMVNVTGLELESENPFVLGQQVEGPGIAPGTTLEGVSGSSLTLSQPATETIADAEINGLASDLVTKVSQSEGAFQAGQDISAANGGIPEGTTIEAVEEVKAGEFELTLSAAATKTAKSGTDLEATSDCVAGRACSYEVSAANSFFWAASKVDGGVAYYTTGNLSTGSAHLFAYDAEAREGAEIAAEVYGVLGASEDAAKLYLASGEVLGEGGSEGAIEGEPNLYLYESGEFRFIGVLDGADVSGAGTSPVSQTPITRNSRITPSGEQIAFMSEASLTGYDNTDANSGEADNEVYLYDAEADELLCVSCNPSGARPEGADLSTTATPFWVAARLEGHQSSLYAGANLSTAGDRLFFESQDPLVPRDSNGLLDVYQWERAGTGGCEEESPTYSEAAKGCIELISSGQGSRDAAFLDASTDGDDVFFATLTSLLPQDYGLVDVYDARVGGGFPIPPPPPPGCEGEACQSPAPSPALQALGSITYAGPGNLAPPKKQMRCPKGKRKVKRKGKVRCVKKKRAVKRSSRAAHSRSATTRSDSR